MLELDGPADSAAVVAAAAPRSMGLDAPSPRGRSMSPPSGITRSSDTELGFGPQSLIHRHTSQRRAQQEPGHTFVGGSRRPGLVLRLLRSPDSHGPVLDIRGLRMRVPGGGQQVICDGLTLALETGQSMLVVGPSGCGKSSLLRAIAGLWSEGEGAVCLPEAASMFFCPQKPFMPLGTLRQQLTFPATDGFTDDEQLRRLLAAVGLPNLESASLVGGQAASKGGGWRRSHRPGKPAPPLGNRRPSASAACVCTGHAESRPRRAGAGPLHRPLRPLSLASLLP